MKTCFKCGEEKELSEFYRHPAMADGRLGKCKDCARADVQANYAKNREHYSLYDRERQQNLFRRAAKHQYRKLHRERHPDKHRARNAVSNAVRDGRLKKLPCEVCGDPCVQAHHHDYSKPLDVRWLCFKHHREIGHGQIVTAA